MVIASGDHQWEASSEGNGAVDALLRAVDAALGEVLTGHPRLVAYDVHALGEGPGAEGRVTLTIEPPSGAEGRAGRAATTGRPRDTNIIAASVEAYVQAINAMLAESHWAGAADSAGNARRRAVREGHPAPRRGRQGRRSRGEHRLVRPVTRGVDGPVAYCRRARRIRRGRGPGRASATWNALPCGSFRDVFAAVDEDRAVAGLDPDRERRPRDGPRELRPAPRVPARDPRRGRRARATCASPRSPARRSTRSGGSTRTSRRWARRRRSCAADPGSS